MDHKRFSEKLFSKLKDSKKNIKIGHKNFNILMIDSLNDLFVDFNIQENDFIKWLDIDKEIFLEIKKLNKKLLIALMQNYGTSRKRSNNDNFVLAQGHGKNYIGDDYWLNWRGEVNSLDMNNKLVIQLHDITFTNENISNSIKNYFLVLLTPKELHSLGSYYTNNEKYEKNNQI